MKLEKLDVEKLLKIDQNNLAEEFTKQAALYGYWSGILAEAERVRAECNARTDLEYAIADNEYRTEYEAQGKKFTEAVIKSEVTRDEIYQGSLQEYRDADYVYSALRGLLKALDMRASMLISLGATIRAEQDMTGMTMRERQLQDTKTDLQDAISKVRAR